MEKTYSPESIEKRWYESWERQGYFLPAGTGDSYCIMLPPPNVTGYLHMGHAFQQTLMDLLIRYHRMRGDNTLWQCGTDHAGIATQMVVERQLEQQGRNRIELGRDEFVAAVWKWKQASGSTITNQSRRLGTSMDWSRERFTMDAGLSHAVREVFVRLYDEDLIYRGKRLVNWDPVLHTAVSDLEVVSTEEDGSLWHIRYPLVSTSNGLRWLVVATTRPETMLGDVAVAVHPEDSRYRDIIGSECELPLTGRRIPVVADAYVDPEFGTGCVKITPAHDFNDYAIGQRHNLPLINIFTIDAVINEAAPEAYRRLDRYAARKQIVSDLEQAGLMEKIVPHKLTVPRGDRSNAVIEPYLTDQWYVRIAPLAGPAIQAVEDGSIEFIPDNWRKTYFEWMHNIEDWCISRQLWWGHRIPAWYDAQGNVYVGRDEAEVRTRHGLGEDSDLRQDEDVLDTWFSSGLWPFSTLGWPDDTPELRTFYPTSVLVTGFDIIFFWVARMIMLGLKFMGDVPFRKVYFTGLIRDEHGQKMSKSKGNILDPLDLIDGIDPDALVTKRTAGLMQPRDAPRIEKATRRQFPEGIAAYGTDAMRFTFTALASNTRDINFDTGRIGGYRNFCNKIWNATRYVMMNVENSGLDIKQGEREYGLAERWINSMLYGSVEKVTTAIEQFRFDQAAQALYEFTWDEYCDWYLEFSKTVLNDPQASAAARRGTLYTLVNVLEVLLRLMHPVMPFITEELWHKVAPLLHKSGATIMLQAYPEVTGIEHDSGALGTVTWLKNVIIGIRRIRAERDLAPGKPLSVLTSGGSETEKIWLNDNLRYIQSLARVDRISEAAGVQEDAAMVLAGEMTLLVPLAELIDMEAELTRLERELQHLNQEKQRIEAKLSNTGFVERAPAEVVAREKARLDGVCNDLARVEDQARRLKR